MIENFQVEEFLSKSLQQLYVSDEIEVPPDQKVDGSEAARQKEITKNITKKKKSKVKIPKFLENTPYFAAFSKLTDNYELEEKKRTSVKKDHNHNGINNAVVVSKEVIANENKVEVRVHETARNEILDNNRYLKYFSFLVLYNTNIFIFL